MNACVKFEKHEVYSSGSSGKSEFRLDETQNISNSIYTKQTFTFDTTVKCLRTFWIEKVKPRHTLMEVRSI